MIWESWDGGWSAARFLVPEDVKVGGFVGGGNEFRRFLEIVWFAEGPRLWETFWVLGLVDSGVLSLALAEIVFERVRTPPASIRPRGNAVNFWSGTRLLVWTGALPSVSETGGVPSSLRSILVLLSPQEVKIGCTVVAYSDDETESSACKALTWSRAAVTPFVVLSLWPSCWKQNCVPLTSRVQLFPCFVLPLHCSFSSAMMTDGEFSVTGEVTIRAQVARSRRFFKGKRKKRSEGGVLLRRCESNKCKIGWLRETADLTGDSYVSTEWKSHLRLASYGALPPLVVVDPGKKDSMMSAVFKVRIWDKAVVLVLVENHLAATSAGHSFLCW